MATWPDITFTVNRLAPFTANPWSIITVAETDMVWPRFLFWIFSSGVLELGITLSHWEILLTHSIIRKIHYPQWANKSRDLEYLSTNRRKCDWLRQGGITGCVPITLCCQMRMPLAFVMGYGLHSPDSAWCLTCHNTWQTNENLHNESLPQVGAFWSRDGLLTWKYWSDHQHRTLQAHLPLASLNHYAHSYIVHTSL